MKKLSIRNFFLIFLVTASITSYGYLSCVAAENRTDIPAVISSEEEEITAQQTFFPDITLVQKIIETSKRFIPKSS